jgi:hypothetical protein
MTEIEHLRATIEQIRLTGEHMRAEQDKWRAGLRRETIRIVLYGVLIAAAWAAAGAAIWEQIRPT